jgi:hypothetical protein
MARMGKIKNSCKIFVGKVLGKWSLGTEKRHGRIRRMPREDGRWTQLAPNGIKL